MREEFLKGLKNLLDKYEMNQQEKEDILNDYDALITEAEEHGKSEEEIFALLGSPEAIMQDLKQEYRLKKRIKNGDKFIALSPFISLVIFMILGLVYDLWHPGWLAFLLIPMTAIVIEMINDKDKHLFTALSPFIALIVFMVLGEVYGLWHPAWLVFLIIPMFAIINSRKSMAKLELLTALSPFISIIAFALLYQQVESANPLWLVFLLVVYLGVLHEEKRTTKLLLLLTLTLSIALYLLIGLTQESWLYASASFLVFLIPVVFTNNKVIQIEGLGKWQHKLMTLLLIIAFVLLGVWTGLWAYVWIVFLLLPMYFIFKDKKEFQKITALSPFIALILFMTLGTFYDAWAWAWLMFLLIPVIAIIEDK